MNELCIEKSVKRMGRRVQRFNIRIDTEFMAPASNGKDATHWYECHGINTHSQYGNRIGSFASPYGRCRFDAPFASNRVRGPVRG